MNPSSKNPRPPVNRTRPAILGTSVAALLALCLIPRPVSAQTWVGQPGVTNGSWNTAGNWTPATVPNATGATATFGSSSTTSILLPTSIQLSGLTFNVNATVPYVLTNAASLTLNGAGVTNNSGGFNEYFENLGGASVSFANSSSAGLFTEFTNDGASITGGSTGSLFFENTSTADAATIINQGGAVSGGAGGTTVFSSGSTAASATIISNGGVSFGGSTFFEQTASGGTASALTNGNGVFDISGLTNAGMTIGSIAGSGTYFLGSKTLTVGSNNATTTVIGRIADGGQFGGAGGSLVKTGTGTLTLAGTNTYTGSTVINGGILQVNGAINSTAAVTVNSGGMLAGTGTLAGPVTVNSGGVLAHSNSSTPGTITVGGLTLSTGSKADYELGAPGTSGGGVNDLTMVNGNLALGGTLNLTELSGFGAGSYELFSYTGTLTGSSMSLGTLPAGFTASEFTFQTSIAHEVNLVVSGGPAVQYWDGAITSPNSAVNGGSGTWNGGTTNWTNATGTTNSSWGQSVAIFSTSSGTVTVASNITAGEMRFTSAAGAYTFNINSSETLTISGVGITNTSANAPAFTMAVDNGGGSGGLHFTNAATAGNASITTPGAIGVALGGGSVQFLNTSSAGTATITNSAGGIEDGGGGITSFLNGSTAGNSTIKNNGGGAPGGMDFDGNGETFFSNTSSAGTAEIINHGSAISMSVGGATTFSDSTTAAGATIFNEAGVDATSMGSTTFASNSTAGSATISNQGAAAIGGLGGLLSFDGNATAGSANIINGGDSSGGALGGSTQFLGTSSAGNATIVNQNGAGGIGGATYFDQNADGGTARAVTDGNGVFDISGLTGSGMNIGSIEGTGTYFLGSKTLTVGGNNLSTTVSGSIEDGGLSGGSGGSLVKTGTGTLILTNTNTYTGSTVVNGGELQVNGSLLSSTITVNAGGTLGGSGSLGGLVTVNAGGMLTHGASGTAATLTVGGLTLNNGSAVDYQLGAPGTNGGGVNDLTMVQGNLTLGGTLDITSLSGFAPGTYELFSYTGALTGSTLSIGTVPAGFVPQNFTVQTSVTDEVNLIVTGPLYWNGTVTTADGTVHGGTGNWDNMTINWTDAAGATSSAWQGANGIFSGAAGTVSLTDNIAFGALEFSTSGYVIKATGAFGLSFNGGATITTDTGANTTIGAPIQGNGTLLLSGSAGLTLSGALSDHGGSMALTQNSSGTTILSNAGNTYSGPTTINSGVLQIGAGATAGSIGAGPVGVNSGGTLSILNLGGNPAGDTFANNVSNGVGGTGTLNVNSANTNILSGALTNGTAGTLALTQSGSGMTILTNAGNTDSGATTVTAGTLQIGTGSAAGSIGAASAVSLGTGTTLALINVSGNVFANTVSGGGTLILQPANPLTVSGDLSGQMGVNEIGGTAILTYVINNYFGGTTVSNGGTLQLGSPSARGSLGQGKVSINTGGSLVIVSVNGGLVSENLSNGVGGMGTVIVNSSLNNELEGTLTDGAAGKLAVVQSGSGMTALQNSGNTYSGGTTVNGGILEVTNSSGSGTGMGTVTVNGGTLTGTGTIAGNVTLAGGSLIPGSIPFAGKITVGGLTLNSGTVDFRLAAPTSAQNDLVDVANNITLGGTLNVETQSGFTTGTYTLFDFNGTVSGSFSSITGLTGYTTSIVTTTPDEVQLVVSSMGTVQSWVGGSGNWSATGTNWLTGSNNSVWQSGTGVFNSPNGTVTLTTPISAQSLIFNTTAYTLAGTQTLTMTGSAPAITVPSSANSVTIGVPIAGNTGLAIGGHGTVILTNSANSFTGTTTIDGAVLEIGVANATAGSLGAGPVVVQNGGSLELESVAGTTFANNVSGGLGGGFLESAFLNNITLSGALTDGAAGPLALYVEVGGTTILTNPGNTYSGLTYVYMAGLQIGTASLAGSVGPASPIQLQPGGTLTLVNVAGNTLANPISNTDAGVATVVVNSTRNITLSGPISDNAGSGTGSITLTQSGSGTTTLAATDTYVGPTNVTAGVLQIGNGTTGNLTASNVTVSNSASLLLDQVDGSSSKINVTLSASGTTLKAIQSGHLTLGGVISGPGALDQNGSGVTELQAAQTYTGATNINEGTLEVDTSLAAGSIVHVGTSGILAGAGAIAGNVTLTGNGNVDLAGGSIGGTLTVTGGNWTGMGAVNGLITSSSGAFTIGSGATLNAEGGLNVTGGMLVGNSGTLSGNLTYASSSSSVLGDAITGTGALTLNNAAATLDLTGTNTYTGVTTVNAGTLQVDGSLASGTAVNVLGAGVLSGAGTIGGNVSVSGNGIINLGSTGAIDGAVVATGARWNGQGAAGSVTSNSGTFTLSGSLTTSTLTMNGGTLAGSGILNGSLVYDSTSSSTFGGSIATAISIAGNGATLTLTGASTLTGAVTVSAGTLQIGNGTSGNLSASSVSLTNSALLVTDLANNSTFTSTVNLGGNTSTLSAVQTGSNTLSGVISGVGFINQKGTGTTILNNTETYTGSTNVSVGTLQIGDGTNGNLSSTSGVVVTGSGVLALNLVDGTAFTPTIALNTAGATLKAIQSGTVDISGVISGAGMVDQNGSGTTVLQVAETYTGTTNVNSGILAVDGSLTASSTVNIGTAGELIGTGTINGKAALTGNGTIDFDNGTIVGALAVTGGNWLGMGTVNGPVTSSSGTFTIGALSTLTAPAGLAVTGGMLSGAGQLMGTLTYTSSSSSTFAGVIADGTTASSLTMNKASSTLIITGTNTYSGTTTVSAGTLQVGDGVTSNTALSSGAITVSGTGILAVDLPDMSTFTSSVKLSVAGATLKTVQAHTNTISGVISGTGGLNQSGTGTTIIPNAQPYTGTTSVSAGTLQIDGALAAASTVNVAATGTLDGTGTIPGTVNVLAGGNINAGDSSTPGTLTVGKLVLNAGSNSTFRLAAPGTVGNGVNDLVQVTGNLTLAGNLNITPLMGFGATGNYTLFTYGGTLTNTGFTGINGTAGYTVSVVTGVAHQVDLQIVSKGFATQYWDGTGAINNNNIAGGSGTWNNTTSNWTNAAGSTNSGWQGGMAVFDAPGGTVTLAAPINTQGITFGSTGYTLSGSSNLNLVGPAGAPPVISVTSAGATATIGAPITGTAGLSASGAGTLILTSMTNSYTGGTNIAMGVVQIGTAAASGSIGGGTISIASGGTLSLINLHGNILANSVTNTGAGTGILMVNATTANTLSGALTDGTGQLSLTQSGTGTTTLTNAGNTFNGPTTISKGTLQIGTATAPGSLGSNSAVSVGSGSTLSLVNVAGNSLGNNISDGASGTGTVSINAASSLTLGGTLSNGTGTLALTKAGTGTAILTGTDSYTGATTVSAGILQIGNGTAGNLTATSGVSVSGTGLLAIDLVDTSTFGRNVNLSATTASLKAIQAGTNTLSGVISGAGSVNQNGNGTTVLNTTETYTGMTNVTTGTLEIDGILAAGSTVNVATAGTLSGLGTIKGKTTLNGNGTIDLGGLGVIDGTLAVTGGNWTGLGMVDGLVTSSSGTFIISGDLTAPAGLAVTAGTIAATNTGKLTGSLNDTSGTSMTFAGAIAGATSTVTMNKAASTLTLTGTNSYGGATTVTAGTLQLGDGTNTGASLGSNNVTVGSSGTFTTDLAANGNLTNGVIDNGHVVATGTTNNYKISGIVSGTGNLTMTGSNTVMLTAANSYKGGTTVSSGTLLIDNTASSGTGTGAVTINNGGTLGGSGTITGATTLNSGGALFPSAGTPGTAGTTLHESSLLWNGGGTLTLQLSNGPDDALALNGALTKGSAGTYTLDLLNAGLLSTSTYNLTLITFASTTFTAANFNVEFPLNYDGTLVVTSTSLEIENLTDPPPGEGQQPEHADLPATGTIGSDFNTPSDLTITPTPEPGSTLLLAFGGAALLAWRRRRG